MPKVQVLVEFDTDNRQTNVQGPTNMPLLCIDILAMGIKAMTGHMTKMVQEEQQKAGPQLLVPDKRIIT